MGVNSKISEEKMEPAERSTVKRVRSRQLRLIGYGRL